jgi:hypothetical protein
MFEALVIKEEESEETPELPANIDTPAENPEPRFSIEEPYFCVEEQPKFDPIGNGQDLFGVLRILTRYVASLWEQYRNDQIGLITAAVTAEVALEYGLELIQIYMNYFGDHVQDNLSEVVYAGLAEDKHPEEPLYPNNGLPYNWTLRAIAEFSLLTTKLVLQEFRKEHLGHGENSHSENQGTQTTPNLKGWEKAVFTRYYEEKAILFDILLVFTQKQTDQAVDATSHLFRAFLESAKIPLGLVFAAKIFQEARRVLWESYSKPINDLALSSLCMLKTIDTHRRQ